MAMTLEVTGGVTGPALRRFLVQTLVRTVLVVVPGVLGQHLSQVPLAEDQHVVQALVPQRAHEPLRVGVRPRRPDRRPDYPRAISGEDAVECRGELTVRSRVRNLNPLLDQGHQPGIDWRPS
jgi:hypothetical protein